MAWESPVSKGSAWSSTTTTTGTVSTATGLPNTLAVNNSPGIETDDGNWHTMVVSVVNGAFTVTADGNSEFTSYTPSGWSNGSYYLGFGGGTGGLANYHRVRNVSVTFVTPHCY
jgi:hypothetical protein